MAATKDMDVEVLHALTGIITRIHKDAEAIGQLLLGSDSLDHAEAMAVRGRRNIIGDIAIVILGDDEHMRGHQGLHVAKCYALVVLVDLVGGNLSGANLAEDAGGVCHGYSSVRVVQMVASQGVMLSSARDKRCLSCLTCV